MYGISPSHTWLSIFECCLSISCRIKLKVCQVKGDKNKAEFAEREREVQEILWKIFRLIVHKSKPGGFSNTNDGNTACGAF